ncbi:MAG: GGDEF and EAL domain-containing protein [Pseudomonadota bacterium]
MPSTYTLKLYERAETASYSASERFTNALVALTRTVWHADCTFETAIGAICEVAASAMQVERVSVWEYQPRAKLLRCLQAHSSSRGAGTLSEDLDTLTLEGDDYIEALKYVRALDVSDVEIGAADSSGLVQLRDYLHKFRIHARLDAPACVDGEMLGVICLESVDRAREWTQEEVTFAASMGDYVAMAYQISRRREAEEEVRHLRLHDATTGLPNRDYMVEMVSQRLAAQASGRETLAVLHVHIDPSSGVALSATAPTAEEVMARVGQCLWSFTDADIDLARVRTDAFALVVARRASGRGAISLAERCLAAISSMHWQHEEISPGAAVGVAFAEAAHPVDARVLLRQAEEACGRARELDKFAYHVFDPDHHAALVEALQFERVLRAAFVAGQFEMFYQPEYDPTRDEWVAAEALLRWRDGERVVPACDIIGVIESSGLILAVGKWVLHRACQDATQWSPLVDGSLPAVRVNVSSRQFDETDLVGDVMEALQASGLAPARLCLELTETTLMRDLERALEVLVKLRSAGVSVAIDDFGTGYASLVYLKRLPVDMLKIDRSFVRGIPASPVDTAIVRAVVGLATALGIDVIAEGVEHVHQQQALQAMGVRRMQGWLYARAMEHAKIHRSFGDRSALATHQNG